MPPKPEEEEIDEKTIAVFAKKGYKILEPLGHGNYGMVYKGTAVRTGEPVACKVMNLDKIDAKFKDKFVTRELAAMIEAKHKYIIQLFDIFWCNRRVYVFMELAANGDLMGFCKKCPGGLPLKKAYHWFRQSCEGLYYVHNTLFIAHRDLKLENILLDKHFFARISDFGFAKKSLDKEKMEIILSTTFCGTPQYFCPQIVRKKRYDPFKADVWAMGVLLFAMINDRFPYDCDDTFKTNQEMEDTEHLKNRYRKKDLCKHIKQLIQMMLTLDESDRYSIKDVLNHKWIEGKLNSCQSVAK